MDYEWGMASIRRIASGWQAQIARNRVRKSKTFPTKREAQDWGARQEHQILSGEGEYDSGTFGDILKRYGKHESPKKRGGRWEDIRLNKIARDKIGAVRIQDLAASDLADWRDRRLLDVSPVSVRREMQLLSAVLNVAVKEWGLLRKSPMPSVAKAAGSSAPRNLCPLRITFRRHSLSKGSHHGFD